MLLTASDEQTTYSETSKIECCWDYILSMSHISTIPCRALGLSHSEHQPGNAIGNTLATSGFKPRPAKAENSRYHPCPQLILIFIFIFILILILPFIFETTEHSLKTPHHECRWNYKAVTLEVVGSNPTGSIL
jgi:hypothetical protein